MLVNLVLAMFGVGGGAGLGLRDGGMIAIGFSLLCIALAAFSFLIDFDAADQMIRAGAPEKAAWGVALGLTVTLVWLYIEILRLLSYFQQRLAVRTKGRPSRAGPLFVRRAPALSRAQSASGTAAVDRSMLTTRSDIGPVEAAQHRSVRARNASVVASMRTVFIGSEALQPARSPNIELRTPLGGCYPDVYAPKRTASSSLQTSAAAAALVCGRTGKA